MKTINRFDRSKVTHHALRLIALGCAGLGYTSTALAAGTVAGTDIENIATATYDAGGGPISIDSNKVIIKVDEVLDVTVAGTDPGDVRTTSGATNTVLTYKVTNTGNGSEAFTLTADVNKSGDDFNPALQQIILDTNGNGVYDPGVDTVYVAGTNDPVIAPDQSITVFVISNVPNTVVNGNRAEVGLEAKAKTGSGAPGTSFAGAGDGGGDAVVGTTTAKAEDTSFLSVQAVTVVLNKTATILDPFGGSRPVPGAVVTYKLIATVSGAGTMNNLVITDPIPSKTTYSVESITLETAALTDSSTDADAGNFNGSRISVAAGNVPAGQTRTVTFKVKIQ
jgi:uncharacterized repeat protein (TIGR01451 family)